MKKNSVVFGDLELFMFGSDTPNYVVHMMNKHAYTFLPKTWVAFAGSAMIALALMATPANAQAIGQCLSPAAANAAVQSGSILKLPQVMQMAGIGRDSTLHNQRVCFVNNQLAYVIDVLSASGTTQQLILRGSDGTPYN